MMETLDFAENLLVGTIDFSQFPHTLQRVSLDFNALSGTVDFTQLREGIQYLWLSNNSFEGIADIQNPPSSLLKFSIHGNNWSRIVLPSQGWQKGIDGSCYSRRVR